MAGERFSVVAYREKGLKASKVLKGNNFDE
jgi:hypothetical protein